MALVLVGASGLAREALAVLREGDVDVLGVLDDRAPELRGKFAGLPVLGTIADAPRYAEHDFVLAIGSASGRGAVLERLIGVGIGPSRWHTVLDPAVRNPSGARIGAGSILLAGVTLTADATLGRCVVAMPQVTVTHDCVIRDGVTLAAGVSLGGGVEVAERAYLGMNCSIRPGVRIGAGAVVGMGAVVLADIPDGETWAGVPARELAGRS